MDLENPAHVKLQEPILQAAAAAEFSDHALGVTVTDHLDGDHRELMGAEVSFSSGAAGVVGLVGIRSTGVVGVAGSALTGLGVVEESRSFQPSRHGDHPDPVAVEAARSVGCRRAVGVGAPVRRGSKPPRHAGCCFAEGWRTALGRSRSMILVRVLGE